MSRESKCLGCKYADTRSGMGETYVRRCDLESPLVKFGGTDCPYFKGIENRR